MPAQTTTVVIADQDEITRLFVADNLQADGYRPVCAGEATAVLRLLRDWPDVLILDVSGETVGVLDAIRGQQEAVADPQLPVLVLTSQSDELHRVRLLDRGADDVVCKPFSYPELRARLAALLRRADARRAPHVLRAGALRLDARSRRVWLGETELRLPGKEYELLRVLISEPDRVFAEQLLRDIWGLGGWALSTTRTLDSHAARLRKKLGGFEGGFVVSAWGVGYCLVQASCVPNEDL